MPAANVRRRGMGSPEPSVNREGTQVENLCYEEPGRLRQNGARSCPCPGAGLGGKRSQDGEA